MKPLVTLLLAVIVTAAMTAGGAAQPVSSVPRVGLLFVGSPEHTISQSGAAFRETMRSLGWVDGSTISYEYRFANDDPAQLPTNAAELAAAQVAAIVAFGMQPTRAARDATSAIPIVMAAVADPVGSGLVASLAHPGGNVTGVSLMTPDVTAKQLEILKEAVPRVSKVAVLLQRDNPLHAELMTELSRAATVLSVSLLPVAAGAGEDLPHHFDDLTAAGADAYFVLADQRTDAVRGDIAALGIRHRLPGAAQLRFYVEAGVLLGYGANLFALQSRAATFVDKILKGVKPADLPVEQPTTFELVVNLRTAQALGLAIPLSILLRADEVIE